MELGLRRVADAAGVNYSYLFRVEDGVHIPSDDFLLKLAKLYEITLEEKLNLLMIAHDDIGVHPLAFATDDIRYLFKD